MCAVVFCRRRDLYVEIRGRSARRKWCDAFSSGEESIGYQKRRRRPRRNKGASVKIYVAFFTVFGCPIRSSRPECTGLTAQQKPAQAAPAQAPAQAAGAKIHSKHRSG